MARSLALAIARAGRTSATGTEPISPRQDTARTTVPAWDSKDQPQELGQDGGERIHRRDDQGVVGVGVKEWRRACAAHWYWTPEQRADLLGELPGLLELIKRDLSPAVAAVWALYESTLRDACVMDWKQDEAISWNHSH